MPSPTRPTGRTDAGVVHLLVASALGVYLLVIVGATTALLDGAAACPTWPACRGEWLASPSEPAAAAALAHRTAALLVGIVLAASVIAAWRGHVARRVRGALGAAAVLYPVQIALGALTATGGAPLALSSTHLVVGLAIFSGTLVALLWQLEAETPAAAEGTGPASGSAPGDIDDWTPSDTIVLDDSAPAPDAVGASPAPESSAGGAAMASGYRDRADAAPGDGDDDAVADPGSAMARTRSRAVAYLRLTKPKLMWLLCLVAVASMGLAAGPALELATVVATLAGGVLAIGASGTFNNVVERDRDRRMDRTADRPLVEGEIPVRRAVAFGFALAAASVAVFVAFVNVLAAALGLAAVLFYSVVYTVVLKPHTDQNIVVGGAVGAFPALIGWAAVTGAVELPAVVLGAVVFLWTPAHFYNLALAYREDYARAGFPMLPVVRGEATTRRHILGYFGATMVAVVALGAVTPLDWVYAVAATAVAGLFVRELVGQYRDPGDRTAFRTFHASNAYLGVVLLAVLVDAIAI